MTRNTTKIVKCSEEGSGCSSLSGAGIKQIVDNACEVVETAKRDGFFIIEGGGNSLRAIGTEETVSTMVNGIKKILDKKKDIKLAITSIPPRPRENKRYEQMRVAANQKLQSLVCSMKADMLRNKEKGMVSFLDMDSILTAQMYGRDGIHFNAEGDARFGRRLLQWMKEKERCSNGPQ